MTIACANHFAKTSRADIAFHVPNGPMPKEFFHWIQSTLSKATRSLLWFHHLGDYHRDCTNIFKRLITDTKAAEYPVETVGGILGDDMDLGKTLIVISTTVRTAETARLFAERTEKL